MFKKLYFFGAMLFLISFLWGQGEKGGNIPVQEDEMGIFRQILDRQIAIRQDLYDLLAMQFLDFSAYNGAKARNEALKKRGITIKEDTAKPVSRGEVAKALLEAYPFERGLLFSLTKWEFYALRDMQQLGLMETKYTFHQYVTGRQLISLINLAEETYQKIVNYQKIDVTQ